ncbi:P27 family phage terminase small subunit [Desulfatiglans anilini]|uniref:P27 family phage terminase small subunit n=1 Tax=Desulfatiglans anilini TaxID=90728 RepID=UPI0004827DFB|nr:P27 family phage terminase small subunit [Desulfatiglans anilini]
MARLCKEALEWRKKLEAEYNLGDAEAQLLMASMTRTFDQLRRAERQVETDGMTQIDRFGKIIAHPLLSVIRDCRASILQYLKHLGLEAEPPRPAPGRPPKWS